MNKELRIGGKGFTLIELLIVIVIIGILAALIMANFVGIRQRARDGRRKSDLRQIQSAVELYRADQGNYPSEGLVRCGESLVIGNVTYLKKIPCEPSGVNVSYKYTVSGGYTLVACLENERDGEKDATNACSTGVSYTLYNP